MSILVTLLEETEHFSEKKMEHYKVERFGGEIKA